MIEKRGGQNNPPQLAAWPNPFCATVKQAHNPGNETSGSPSSLLSPALDVLGTAELELRRQDMQLHEGGGHMTVTCSNDNSRLAGSLVVTPRSHDSHMIK